MERQRFSQKNERKNLICLLWRVKKLNKQTYLIGLIFYSSRQANQIHPFTFLGESSARQSTFRFYLRLELAALWCTTKFKFLKPLFLLLFKYTLGPNYKVGFDFLASEWRTANSRNQFFVMPVSRLHLFWLIKFR